ncbi:MAG: hypothetical protein IPK66_06950 [Rhodospirillales bacterium]|nr:hypothetical protein [Rhodospirillales bacterium]
MSDDVYTTLIGAATGLVIAVVTSFIIPFVQRRQQKVEERRGIYERYAQPLAADAGNLLWRLDEILVKRRCQYLRSDAPPTTFNQYKLISTCYRIAAVLGWIRAIKLEQSHLFYGDQDSVEALRCAVVSLESALADAPEVELQVLRNLALLWGITLLEDRPLLERIAAQLVADLQHDLSRHQIVDPIGFVGLAAEQQRDVSRRLAQTIVRMLACPPVDENHLAQSCPMAMRALGVRQAWIYRDWQQAIGDGMLREIDGASRRYDIVGYSVFEERFRDPKEVWSTRLRDVVIDVDATDNPDPADCRLQQLRRVAGAIADLICAIEDLALERKVVDGPTCALARRMRADLSAEAACGR